MENNTNCTNIDCENNSANTCIVNNCKFNFDYETRRKYKYSFIVNTKKGLIINSENKNMIPLMASSMSKGKRSLKLRYPGCNIINIFLDPKTIKHGGADAHFGCA